MSIIFKYLARVTIEFITPFHVGNGQPDDFTDSPVIRDPNGLPTIPGSSIAGVLRSEFRKTKLYKANNNFLNKIFGFQEDKQGSGSLLSVSWASIHDSNNHPVESILSQESFSDSILKNAKDQPPTVRDHVRINHKGASDSKDTDKEGGHGKFDEAIVLTGSRFSFELEMSSNNKEEDDPLWKEILNILYKPVLRFGGRTRRGLGAFKIVSCKEACFDLRTQLDAYLATGVSLTDSNNILKDFNSQACISENYKEITLRLKPENYWMFGGGIDNPQNNEKEANMSPVKEQVVIWNNNHGDIKRNYIVIPGSSIKGAISHRVAYYYNLLRKRFIENTENAKMITGENNEAVNKLFGYCKNNKNKKEGARGKVIINDMFMAPDDYKQKLIHHVSIDRFTGGAIPGNLFSEKPTYLRNTNDSINLKLYIESEALADPQIIEALKLTLKDLTNGRLQLGAGSGRGHGYFSSEETFNDF